MIVPCTWPGVVPAGPCFMAPACKMLSRYGGSGQALLLLFWPVGEYKLLAKCRPQAAKRGTLLVGTVASWVKLRMILSLAAQQNQLRT